MSDSLSIPSIIETKRDGGELSDAEIEFFVKAVVNGEAQPPQIGNL